MFFVNILSFSVIEIATEFFQSLNNMAKLTLKIPNVLLYEFKLKKFWSLLNAVVSGIFLNLTMIVDTILSVSFCTSYILFFNFISTVISLVLGFFFGNREY